MEISYNNIYNNYFDLYVQADEAIESNDSLYFAYDEIDVISQISEVENSNLDTDIFSIYDKHLFKKLSKGTELFIDLSYFNSFSRL